MNKERLKQIAIEQGFQRRTLEGSHVHPRIMELLKVAVNESIQECMDVAYENVVDVPIIHEMRNLKVK